MLNLFKKTLRQISLFASILLFPGLVLPSVGHEISVADYESVQAAIDSNPGKQIYVPSGDHLISRPIEIHSNDTRLVGPGRLVQTNPEAAILVIRDCSRVRIHDLTLTRPEGKQECTQEGLYVTRCDLVEIEGVSVLDNRSGAGSIAVLHSTRCTVRDCLVLNYKTTWIDDRREMYGYSFQCVDGTGIKVIYSDGAIVEGNRIIEEVFVPTKENRDRYDLGKITEIREDKREIIPQRFLDTLYTSNWHQGSGMIIGGLGLSEYTIVRGNYIENAAQGLDIHSDFVIISDNIVNGAMMGMKAMHGSKHVLITGNQFSRCDLWGLLLTHGTASHTARAASGEDEARPENIDGGTIVSNNIFSFFGYGSQYWNWLEHDPTAERFVGIRIVLDSSDGLPSLSNIVVTGNIVYDNGQHEQLVDGVPEKLPVRYCHALRVEGADEGLPPHVIVANNILHPGQCGVSNVPGIE